MQPLISDAMGATPSPLQLWECSKEIEAEVGSEGEELEELPSEEAEVSELPEEEVSDEVLGYFIKILTIHQRIWIRYIIYGILKWQVWGLW